MLIKSSRNCIRPLPDVKPNTFHVQENDTEEIETSSLVIHDMVCIYVDSAVFACKPISVLFSFIMGCSVSSLAVNATKITNIGLKSYQREAECC